MQPSKSLILRVTFALEGALVITFFLWAYLRDIQLKPLIWENFQYTHILIALLSATGLCCFNWLLFEFGAKHLNALSTFKQFRVEIVQPLANALDLPSILVVSLAAGIGEELFFRGILQEEFGICFASICFAFLHFGSRAKEFIWVLALYFVFSVFFGVLAVYCGELITPILAHAMYDTLALIYLRKQRLPDQ